MKKPKSKRLASGEFAGCVITSAITPLFSNSSRNSASLLSICTLAHVDANLHHDQVTGRAVTACLHLFNVTSSHWHSKRQATVEIATFGSEFVAARIATDKLLTSATYSCILDLQSDL